MKVALRPLVATVLLFGFSQIGDIQAQRIESNGTNDPIVHAKSENLPDGAVEDQSMRDAHSRTYRNPDGSFTKRQSYGILNFKDEQGAWQAVDESLLIQAETKTVEMANVPLPVSIDLNTGHTTMALEGNKGLRFGSNSQLSFESEHQGFSSQGNNILTPKGAGLVEGNKVTLKNLLPGIDRIQNVHYYSLETDYLLNSVPQIPAGVSNMLITDRYELPQGWKMKFGEGESTSEGFKGELILQNENGKTMATFWLPVIYDASESKEGSMIASYRLATTNTGVEVSLVIPVGWLTDAKRQYPVTIDPTIANTFSLTIGTRLNSSNLCSGSMGINFSSAVNISNTNWNYNFFALAGGYRSEQRSRLVGPSSTSSYVSGCCGSGGTQTYNYNSTTISPASTGAGTLTYLLNAYRTWGSGSTCGTTYNYIVANTWDVTLTYTSSTPPPNPTGITASAFNVCPGTGVTFTAQGASGTPHWFDGSCGSSSPIATGTTVTLFPTVNTTYYVRNYNGLYSASCASVIISMTSSPSASIISSNSPTCNGLSNGSAAATASGGTQPYTYIWSNSSSGNVITGVPAGTYTVTLTDANGCTDVTSTTLTNPAIIGGSFSSTMPSCPGGSDGSAMVVGNGGSGSGYAYTWAGGFTGANRTGLSANTYTVTITDGLGCLGTATLTISDPPALTTPNVSATPTSVCVGAGTPVSLVNSASGSTTYWFAGSCGLNTSGAIGSGSSISVTPTTTTTYYAAIYDGSCWSSCDSVTVPVYSNPVVVAVASNFTICEGSSTSISALGASTYTWSPSTGLNTTFGSTVQASPTSTTTYTVIGTNSNGCTASANATINVNPAPSLTPVTTSPTCNGGNNGVATATPSGGTTPYSYLWAGGITTPSITVSAGTYTVTVTDNLGCSSTLPVTVTDPPAVTATFSSVNASCFTSNDGLATAFGSGGSGFGFSYLWPSGTTNALETGLSAGTHTVTITDGTGCSGTATVTISSPSPVTPPSISASPNSVCMNAGTQVTLTATNGSSTSFTQTVSNLCSSTTGGTLNFLFTGVPAGAVGNGTLTVYYRGDLSSSSETIAYSMDGISVGSSLPTGGGDCQTNYSSRALSINNSSLNSMIANGSINLLADATSGVNNFCYGTQSYCTYATLSYNYVNPNTLYWFAGSCAQNISAALGTGSSFNVTPTATTTYYAASYDGTCWSVCDSTTVTMNPPPTVSAAATTSTLCQGNSTSMTATGALSYTWSPTNGLNTNFGATVTATPSTSTTYTVTGTDGNGCTNTATVAITVHPAPNITTILTTQPTCATGSNGAATAVASGTGTLTYNWSNSASGPSITGLTAGAYTVTVTDFLGCTSTQTAIVNQPAGVSATFSSVNASCSTTNDGVATVFGTSGAGGPFTYLWPSGGASQTENNLSPGSHTVTITDANGCTGTASVTISSPPALVTPSITVSNSSICQGSSSSSTLSAVGGVGSGTYSQTKSISCSSVTGGNLSFSFTGTPTGANSNATLTVYYRGDLSTSGEVISYSLDGTSVGTSLPTGGSDCQTTYSSRTFTLSSAQINSMASNGTIVMLADAASSVNNFCFGSQSYCTYATLTYNYASNIGLYWFAGSCSMNTSAAIGNNGPVTVTPNTTTTYYAAIYNGSCWSLCDSTTITVAPPPTVSATAANATICSGTSTLLTGFGANTYTWSPSTGLNTTFGSSVTASPVSNTTYTVVGTDANGCTGTSTVTVSVLSGPSISISSTPVSCVGSSDGQASAFASGGLAPYTYNWANGSSGNSISGLPSGTILLTVTDANGCTGTSATFVSQPSALSVSVSTSPATCFTSSDGQGNAFGSGGTSPYTYTWSNGSTGSSVNNLSQGSVTVTMTDANGCSTTGSGSVLSPSAISSPGTISSSNGTTFCSGSSSATTLSLPGGGGSTQSFTYTTNNSCTYSTGGNQNFSIPGTPATANGSGTLRVFYNGDIGQTGEIISYYMDGTFVGTSNISPSGDCPTVTYFNDLTVTSAQINSWASNGNINVLGDGATSINNICTAGAAWCGWVQLTYPYLAGTTYWFANSCSFNISNSVGSGGSLSVTPNTTTTYFASVWDGNCWSPCDSITINVDPTPSVAITPSNSSVCPGGSTTLTASGASTYSWSPSTGLNTTSGAIVTAQPGSTTTYTVIGTTAAGCTASASLPVIVNPGVIATPSSPTFGSGNNISCFGANDGSINTNVSSGSSPYTFAWAGPGGYSSAVQNPTGLNAGAYTLTVTDANSCSSTSSLTLSGPSATLQATASASTQTGGFNLSCNGGADGSISLTVSGGSPTYTYSWTGPSSFVSSQQNPSSLAAGSYAVTVSDLAGCTSTSSITLTEPTAISATLTAPLLSNGFNLSCENSSDGSISVTATGGFSPYTFAWSGPNSYSGSGASINGLAGGTYTLTLTDANGCTHTDTQVLTSPTAISTTITPATFVGGVNISCPGNTDGSLTVSASGGAGTYTYTWTGPGSFTGTGTSLSGLAAGLYIVNTTDLAGCQFLDSITLTEPATLSAGLSVTNVTCFGGSDGEVVSSPTGGNSPYSYSWSHDGTLTGNTASGLSAGTYPVIVTDGNGCTTADSVVVSFTNNLPLVSLGNDTNICDGSTLTLRAGSFTNYTWTGGSNADSLDVSSTGFYSVTVTDINTCSNTDTIAVFIDPNPVVSLGNDTSVCGSILLDAGSGYSSYVWNDASTASTLSASNNGSYSVTVTNSNGCSGSSSVNVSIFPAASVNTAAVDASCGNTDGEVSATPAGGNGPYTYMWSTGASSASVNNLSAGTYFVTMTTSDGCTITASASVNNGGAPSLSINGTDVSCAGAADGTASVTATGGASPYNYQWNSGQTAASISNLSGGSYVVNVTDANGCVASASVVVNEPTALVASASSTLATCGQSNASASVVVTGGTGTLTYLWDDPANQSTNQATNLAAGLYSVTVTDGSGCSTVASIGVSNANAASLSVAVTNTTCEDDNDGSVTVTATGGTAPFTYLWDDAAAQTTATASNLNTGTYNVVVTDATGCVSTATASVASNNPAPIVDLGGPFGVICEGSTYTIDAGSAFQTYLWSDGSSAQTLTVNAAGTYTVTVTDFNGCEGIGELTLASDPCVGIDQVGDDFTLNYFPNPTSGELNLVISGWAGKDLTLEVFSIQGQLVYAQQSKNLSKVHQMQIDLSVEAQGIYLLRLSNGDTVETRKVSIK